MVAALPKVSAIYKITNLVNGKRYIGQARNVRVRWYWHRNAACGAPDSSYEQKTAIARAMRKYGFANFTIEILEQCSPELLNDREVYWIARMGTMVPTGYNLTSGGVPARRADEVGARISAANKGRRKTPEWRAALSAAHKGKKLTPEHREKISQIMKTRVHTDESKAKRSAALKGKKVGPYSAERCAAISAGMSKEGHKRSVAASLQPAAMEKRVAKLRGQKRTPEQCVRFSEAQLRRHRPITLTDVQNG